MSELHIFKWLVEIIGKWKVLNLKIGIETIISGRMDDFIDVQRHSISRHSWDRVTKLFIVEEELDFAIERRCIILR